METPNSLHDSLLRLGLFVPVVSFDTAVAFIAGFDHATFGGALEGFREWLVVRVGSGSNLAWSELVLSRAFPDAEVARERLSSEAEHKKAISTLVKLLQDFWRERAAPDGMRRVNSRYERWLKRQPWYAGEPADTLEE